MNRQLIPEYLHGFNANTVHSSMTLVIAVC